MKKPRKKSKWRNVVIDLDDIGKNNKSTPIEMKKPFSLKLEKKVKRRKKTRKITKETAKAHAQMKKPLSLRELALNERTLALRRGKLTKKLRRRARARLKNEEKKRKASIKQIEKRYPKPPIIAQNMKSAIKSWKVSEEYKERAKRLKWNR